MSENRKLKVLEKALWAIPILFCLFVAGGFFVRFIGKCSGGLGSGIKCQGGKFFSTYSSLAEVSLIIAVPGSVIYLLFCSLAFWIAKRYLK